MDTPSWFQRSTWSFMSGLGRLDHQFTFIIKCRHLITYRLSRSGRHDSSTSLPSSTASITGICPSRNDPLARSIVTVSFCFFDCLTHSAPTPYILSFVAFLFYSLLFWSIDFPPLCFTILSHLSLSFILSLQSPLSWRNPFDFPILFQYNCFSFWNKGGQTHGFPSDHHDAEDKIRYESFSIPIPKFPDVLRAVSQDALVEGTIIEINVTTPERKKLLYQCQVESRWHGGLLIRLKICRVNSTTAYFLFSGNLCILS